MIAPLRRAHLASALFLAVSLPAVLMAAFSARRLAGSDVQLPEELRPPSERALESRSVESSGIWSPSPVSGDAWQADVLLYWSSTAPRGEELPAQARLVGSLRPGVALPATPPGQVAIAYGLARGEVLAWWLPTDKAGEPGNPGR